MSANGNNHNRKKIEMGHDLRVAIEIIPDGATLIVDVILGNMKWTLYLQRETLKELGEYFIEQASQ